MKEDGYLTISEMSSSKYVDKKSVFYGFVIPVNSEEMVNDMLKAYRKKYYDARHICYAYCLNADKSVIKSSDNGEPSGTAGRPMLGVLQSYNVTNVLLIAVRYFGGIKLGTSGLIEAYRAVSELALSQSNIIEKTEDVVWSFKFDYSQMNKVMSSVKSLNITVLESSFDLKCTIKLQAPKSIMSRLQSEISDVVINEGE